MKKISVIIPVYNVEKYLERCLNSLLAQTFKDFEIILVDDGSTDNSSKICDSYSKYDFIKVFHKENGGLADARNYGILKSSSPYITFIDSDDFVNEKYLEIFNDIICKSDCDIAMMDYQKVKDGDALLNYEIKNFINISPEEAIKYMLNKGTNAVWGKIYKKFIWDNFKFTYGCYVEDLDIIYNVFSFVKKVSLIHCKLYYYYTNYESLTHQKMSEKKLKDFNVVDKVYDFIIKTYPNLKSEALKLKIRSYLGTLQQILNLDKNSFIYYQNIIINFFKQNLFKVLFNRKIKFITKFKIITIIINKNLFLFLYNLFT